MTPDLSPPPPPTRRSLAASLSRHRIETEPGFVYFAHSREEPIIKIGFSLTPETRLRQVRSDYQAKDLFLLGQMPGLIKHERKIHQAISHYRVWLQHQPRREFYYSTPTTQLFCRSLIERQGIEDWTWREWHEATQWLRRCARSEYARGRTSFQALKERFSAIPGFLRREPAFLRRGGRG